MFKKILSAVAAVTVLGLAASSTQATEKVAADPSTMTLMGSDRSAAFFAAVTARSTGPTDVTFSPLAWEAVFNGQTFEKAPSGDGNGVTLVYHPVAGVYGWRFVNKAVTDGDRQIVRFGDSAQFEHCDVNRYVIDGVELVVADKCLAALGL